MLQNAATAGFLSVARMLEGQGIAHAGGPALVASMLAAFFDEKMVWTLEIYEHLPVSLLDTQHWSLQEHV